MTTTYARLLRKPRVEDDKYSRGVVGFVTGSEGYPGAAILGVTAAIRVGIGMVRYLGPESVSNLLIESRPEVVLQSGRCQSWVVGSGISIESAGEQAARIVELAGQPGYLVVDAGALDLIDFSNCKANCVLTPHSGELSRLLGRLGVNLSREQIEADRVAAALLAGELTGQTILLKGSRSVLAFGSQAKALPAAPAALATAGTGDVLAGVLGALIAANFDALSRAELSLADIVEGAVALHSAAAESIHGPLAALDLTNEIQKLVGQSLEN
jgi:hydroxyethylthiazole kinase-like uncharacterized protein yjeF